MVARAQPPSVLRSTPDEDADRPARRLRPPVTAVLAGISLAALLLAGCGAAPDARRPPGPPAAAVTSAPARPLTDSIAAAERPAGGSTPGAPADPDDGQSVAADTDTSGRQPLAHVLRRTALRDSPDGRVLATLGPRTGFGSPTVLSVVGRRPGWLRVLAPQLPNGRQGWIALDSTQADSTDWRIDIDRSARRVLVRHGGRLIRRFTVAVGRPAAPTPAGRYAVTDLIRNPHPDSSIYGWGIIALTGHQNRTVDGWIGGDRLAIHGTSVPASIGQAASLGCLRAGDDDLRALFGRLPLGTPVFIAP